MSKVCYEEIQDIFDDVWVYSREHFWYKKAWAVLDKCGLTSYEDRETECIVYLRAVTLEMIYKEFCDVTFDEYCEHGSSYYDSIYDIMSDFEIGQLYGKRNNAEMAESESYAVNWLADQEWDSICKALLGNLGINGFYLGMLLTSYTPNFWDLEEDDVTTETDDIDTYDSYWDFIKKECSHIIDELSYDHYRGYDWTLNPYRIRDL